VSNGRCDAQSVAVLSLDGNRGRLRGEIAHAHIGLMARRRETVRKRLPATSSDGWKRRAAANPRSMSGYAAGR
jgi:hypothetical protein